MVEFALILPLLLTILLGVIEFGQAFNNKNELTNLANQAMRYAEVNQCAPCNSASSSIETYIPTTADTGDLKANTTVCFSTPSGTTTTQAIGAPITVKVTAPFNWLNYLGLGASTTISTQVTGRLDVAYVGTGYQGTPTGDQYTLRASC